MAALIQRCASGTSFAKRCASGPSLLRRCVPPVPCAWCTSTPSRWAAVIVANGISGTCAPGCYADWECFEIATACALTQDGQPTCWWRHDFGATELLFFKTRSYGNIYCYPPPNPWQYYYITAITLNVTSLKVTLAIENSSSWIPYRYVELPMLGCDREYVFTFTNYCFGCSPGDTNTLTITVTPQP